MSLFLLGCPRLLSSKTHDRPKRLQRLHESECSSVSSHFTFEVRQPKQLLVSVCFFSMALIVIFLEPCVAA